MRITLVALTLAASLAAVTSAGAAGTELNPNWSAVLPEANTAMLAQQCSRVSPGPVAGTWTPTAADVAKLEPKLGVLLAEQLAAADGATRPTAAVYYRQYAGFVVAGRKIIYVNGFDRHDIEQDGNTHHRYDWDNQPMRVCDGGWLAFGVEYDPATGGFSHFAFNGSL
ncbi:MAG TPA: hypothetical protein VHZ78_09540 [Rhizomicrobium sp.]|jgi:hypothetical protein|nr:hypothetical protein [Rhizomicrobium sp.]